MDWQSLPADMRQALLDNGLRSPDGRWLAARVKPWTGLPQLWLAATDGSTARLLEPALSMYGRNLWSPPILSYHRLDALRFEPVAGGYRQVLRSPATLRAFVRAAASVQWRAAAPDAGPPVVLPAREVSPGSGRVRSRRQHPCA